MMNGVGGGAASASLPSQLHHQHTLEQQGQQPAATATNPGLRQQEGTSGRQTYKSCTFCAKRKRKCDGKLPRCSLCIEKNQTYCHYQLKPPTKPRAGKPAAARRRPSTSTPTSPSCATPLTSSLISSASSSGIGVGVGIGGVKRLAGQPPDPVCCEGNALVVPGTRVVAMEPGVMSLKRMSLERMSLKRCRLSASPATGMVGMQENAFLGDFFGCLGILPLASESIVREAMVEIMLGAMAPRQQQHQFSLPEGEHGYGMAGERPGFGLGFNGRERDGGETEMESKADENPARCILWCAIALGALVRGAPIEYVTGYVSLAREALANCFDGSSIENIRAYLMMSFLHALINELEKNEKYLAFAMSIVSKLRPGEVPEELGAMILTTEKMRMFRDASISGKDEVSAYCSKVVNLPPVGEILEQKDLCNLFLVADRRLNQAFLTDMVSQGAFGEEDVVEVEGQRERVMGEFWDQRVGDGDGDGDGLARGFGKPRRVEELVEMRLNLPNCNDTKLCCAQPDQRDPPPCAGPAVKGYIQEVLPELSRLSEALARSDTMAGIGGVFYHGNVAYMQAVEGKMASSFEALRACADVVQKYPGIVRFRPHLMHCILAASHALDRGMYDAIRKVYNSVGHVGCRPCPPFEEWGGMCQLCDHIFCRSVAREVQMTHNNKRCFEPGTTSDIDDGEVIDSPSSSSSSSPFDLDAPVASLTGVPPGSGGEIRSSASDPVMAKRVWAGLILAEADVVVATEPSSFQQEARLDGSSSNSSSSSTTAPGGSAVPDSYTDQLNLADPVAHRMSEPAPAAAPASAYPATATAANVGWPGVGATMARQEQRQEQEPVARGVEAEAPAGAPAPEPVSASTGRESAATLEDMAMAMAMEMTDADLLDISAVLMSEEGPLDDL